jgi:hypothetical protein
MAGSWSALSYRNGYLNGSYTRPIGLVKTFTADDSDGSMPDESIHSVSGWLVGIDVEFDETTPPDSITVVIKSIGGITLATSAALTESGRVSIDPPLPIGGGVILSASGNTTNSATASIVLLVT